MNDGSWTCERCGQLNDDQESRCRLCETPRSGSAEPPSAPALPYTSSALPYTSSAKRSVEVPRRTIAAAVVVLVVVAAAAFVLTRGGGSSTKSASSGSSPATATTLAPRTAEQRAADEATARAVALQLADGPAGWTAAPTPDAPTLSPAQFAADTNFQTCQGVTRPAAPDAPVSIAGPVLTDGTPRSARSEINIYANSRAARDDFAVLKDPTLPTCILEAVNIAVFHQLGFVAPLPPDVKVGKASISDLQLGNVHGDVVAVRALVPIQVAQTSSRVALDLVYVLKGRTEITLVFITNVDAFTVDFELAVTNKLVDRAPAD